LGQISFGLAQLGDDLFGRVSLHDSSPGPAGPQRLSYDLDQFLGSRPESRIVMLSLCSSIWTSAGSSWWCHSQSTCRVSLVALISMGRKEARAGWRAGG